MKKCVMLSLLLMPLSFSAAVMCTKTYNYVDVGATADQVRAACGEPDAIKKTEADKKTPYPVTRSYFVFARINPRAPKPPGVMFETSNNKVTGISSAGTVVQSTSVCGGLISINDPASTITQCGKPVFEDQGVNMETTGTQKVETWSYTGQAYQPSLVFTFEDGVLTAINQK